MNKIKGCPTKIYVPVFPLKYLSATFLTLSSNVSGGKTSSLNPAAILSTNQTLNNLSRGVSVSIKLLTEQKAYFRVYIKYD